jgi:hypothetical protein
MSTSSDYDSDDDLCSSFKVVERYNIAEFSAALQDSYNFKRATQEIADLWEHIVDVRDPKTRKALQDLLYNDTMMAVSLCDG